MRSQVEPRSPCRLQSTQLGTVRGQRSIVLRQTTQELCLPFQIRQQRGASAQSNDNGPLPHYGRGASSSSDFRFARNGHFFNGQGSDVCFWTDGHCFKRQSSRKKAQTKSQGHNRGEGDGRRSVHFRPIYKMASHHRTARTPILQLFTSNMCEF